MLKSSISAYFKYRCTELKGQVTRAVPCFFLARKVGIVRQWPYQLMAQSVIYPCYQRSSTFRLDIGESSIILGVGGTTFEHDGSGAAYNG